ncbi:MAG: hypothetical protein VX000_02670, partial [Myxococcota bacterium]|nr:hypothetical protein [Myxococcota bacterium]
RLGAVLQQQGAWEEALAALRACVRHDPTGASGVAARARIDDLTREAPEPPDVTTLAEPPADVPAAALEGYRIARIYLDRGDTERARAELLPVQKLAPDWTAVLNLQAALALRDGDEPGAIASWERSLVQDPAQPRVKLVLGELARRDGADRRAERLLREAATEGAPDAHYQLAAMAFEQHRLFDAREELDAFLAASTGGLNHQPARQLQRTVERRILIGQLGAGGGLLSVIGLLLGYAVWRRGRHPLEALVRAAPEASHDVARVLSSIRHEVLKHNTTLLDEVAHAIEHGDHHAVAFAAERLIGGPGDKGGGAVQRFEAYLGVLHRMGGQYGVRLDLRKCDPVLAPMWQAMGRLQAL